MPGADQISTETKVSLRDRLRGDRDLQLDLAALSLIALVLLLPVPGLMRYQGPPMEEGFMLAFPEQLLSGRYPHRDFLHLYGPGSLWTLAGVYSVFGVDLFVQRTVGLLQHAGVAFGMFFLLRPFGRRIGTAAAVTTILVLIGPGGLSAMAWNGALALSVCALALGTAAQRHADDRTASRMLIGTGILGGVALLYRPDMVIAVGLGLGAIWLTLDQRRRMPLLWSFAGTLALYVPHLLLAGIEAAFRGMFLEPVFELRAGRTLPAPPSWDRIDGFLQRAGALRTEGWPFPMPGLPQQIYLWFWLVPLSIVLVLYAAWRLRSRAPASAQALALWPAALYGAALLPQALQRPDTTHLAWVTGITFALCIPSITSLIEERRPSMRAPRRLAVALGALAVVFLAVIPFYPVRTYVDLVGQTLGLNRFGFAIINEDRRFYYGDAEAAAGAQRIVDRLAAESEPGQSLIVGPTDLSRTNYNDAFLYYLFPELVPGTHFIEMDPGIADAEGSSLADELRRNDWLILSEAVNGWEEPNDSAVSRSQEPNRVVESQYCEVDSAGGFVLLRRCR